MASAMATLTLVHGSWPLSHWILPFTGLSWSSWQMLFASITKPNQLLMVCAWKHSAEGLVPIEFHDFVCTTSFRRCLQKWDKWNWFALCWEKLYGIHGIHSQALRNMSPKITNNFAGPSAEHSWGLSPLSPHHHVETHSKLCIFGVCMHANRFTVRESALETRFCPKSITYQEALVPLSVAMRACQCFQSAHHEPAKCK